MIGFGFILDGIFGSLSLDDKPLTDFGLPRWNGKSEGDCLYNNENTIIL